MMMQRLFTLAALGTLLALPAAAQQSATHTARCEVHRNDQMRCALRIPMIGQYDQRVSLVVTGNGRVTGQAQVWISECGLPGNAGPVRDVRNSGGATEIRRTRIVAASVSCPELFVFNCRQDGQAVPCSRGFGNASIRVEQTQ